MRPRTHEIRLRRASLADIREIRRISGRVRTRDYVPRMFPRWVRDPRSYTLVAEAGGRVVAVSRARLVTPREAWGQGIRVDPAWQGHGIGLAITRHWPNVLHRRGARVARVAVVAGNRPSLRMMVKSGFRLAARSVRRGWWGQALPAAAPASRGNAAVERVRDAGGLWRRIRREPGLARNGFLVLGGDFYAALTRAGVGRYVRRGDAYRAGPAFCLVDRRGIGLVPSRSWWIVALGGPPRDAAGLARAIVQRAARHRAPEVWIDAGRDRRLAGALERAGFTAPSSWGEVVVMEARLPLRGSS